MAQSKSSSTTFIELPDHLKEEILAWLPVDSVCRFRSVCQRWNALFSSTRFITTIWRRKPPNRSPWLIVKSDCLVYCFFTRTWKKASSIALENANNEENDCFGSAAGLFLLSTAQTVLSVCNPLTRTFLELPPISSVTIDLAGIVAGEGESPDTYKVVVVGKPSSLNAHIVEIYDSSDRLWRTAGHLPDEIGKWVGTGIDMVFCDGSLYCLMGINVEWSVMGFNIREGTSFSTAVPEMANAKRTFPYLLVCGSRLLVTCGIVKKEENILQEVIIWEFEKVKVDESSSSSSSRWQEIARMPLRLCESVNRIMFDIDCPFLYCVGVGDCACFMVNVDHQVMEVVVYNLSEKTWSRLPNCPLDDDTAQNIWEGNVMAFEPRPDMKVR